MRRLLSWTVPALWLLGGCAGNGIHGTPRYERPPPVVDGAGNWTIFVDREPFGPDGSRRMCTPDRRLCALLRRAGGWALDVEEDGGPARTVAAWPKEADIYYYLDAFAFREARGAWLIAIDRNRYRRRSNGSRSAVTTSLFRIVPGVATAAPVLDAPTYGDNDPSCAGPGNCPPIRLLEARFYLDLANRSGPPRFILDSFARMILRPRPPPTSQGESTARGTPDEACSYRRIFSLDPASGRYLPDAPLPACDDYLNVDG